MENEVKKLLFKAVGTAVTDTAVEVLVPSFFGKENADLKLTFTYFDEVFYVNDNGSAVAQLKKRVGDGEQLEEILRTVGTNLSFDGERTVGAFCQAHTFFRYVQMLVFVANADLYYKNFDEDGLRFDSDIVLPEESQGIDLEQIKRLFEDGIYFSVNDDGSYRITPQMFYSTFSTFGSYQVEFSETSVTISDIHKGKTEGELFEAFYWDHDDITKYIDELKPYLDRFGAEFDGKDVYITDSAENFNSAFLRFFNLSVLLSEFGGLVLLPKQRCTI